ncbi:MAG TPA: FtsW/RodA/SpoVE family cell cycle protein, partial [Firmicutes bacterium]|nr:FtsW/RodA/SpoVE family cell cycle protein [Bacillota bacterium]
MICQGTRQARWLSWNIEGLSVLPALMGFTGIMAFAGPVESWWQPAIPVAFVVASLAVMGAEGKVLPGRDGRLLPAAIFLSGIGLVEVFRLRPELVIRQFTWVMLGLALFLAIPKVIKDYHVLEGYTHLAGMGAVVLLAVTILFGREVGGARAWVRLFGMSLEPSEAAKLLMVVFLAGYLSEVRRLLANPTYRVFGLFVPEMAYIGPMLLTWGLSLLLLIFQRDLGTALLLFVVFLSMLYMASGRASYVLMGLALLVLGGVITSHLFDHVRTRVLVWLN